MLLKGRLIAVQGAIRVDVAAEIRGVAADAGRVNIAAPLVQDVPHGKYLNVYFPCILFFSFSVPTLAYSFGTIRRHIWLLQYLC